MHADVDDDYTVRLSMTMPELVALREAISHADFLGDLVSQRLEHGDDWRAQPGELPDGVDLALDLGVGIVVRSRHRGGRLGHWFTNEIVRSV